VEVQWFQEVKVVLPSYKDDEGQAITMQCVEYSKASLPLFVKLEMLTMSLVFNPTPTDKAGKYSLIITLTDSIGASTSYPLDVIVTDPKQPFSFLLTQGQKSSGKKGSPGKPGQ